MKKVLFLVLFMAITLSSYAQKKGSPEQRANEYTEYIAKSLDMSKEEATFLNKTLLTKYNSVTSKLKENDLSKEEKKAIYKDSYAWTNKELKTKFSDKEVKEIFALIKEFNQKKKK